MIAQMIRAVLFAIATVATLAGFHEPHRRPRHCLANRFRVGSVGLPALHIRFDVGGGISRTSWPSLISSRAQ
jgi:hypothetical protein